jgi:hypothetical protein
MMQMVKLLLLQLVVPSPNLYRFLAAVFVCFSFAVAAEAAPSVDVSRAIGHFPFLAAGCL